MESREMGVQRVLEGIDLGRHHQWRTVLSVLHEWVGGRERGEGMKVMVECRRPIRVGVHPAKEEVVEGMVQVIGGGLGCGRGGWDLLGLRIAQ